MARFPGTERPLNKAGWTPGAVVRCRRSRANAARQLADRRGFISEVRAGHVRVLFDTQGQGLWLESEALLPEASLDNPDLELMRQAFSALGGLRLETEENGVVIIFGEGYPVDAVDEIRSLLGDWLVGCEITPHGVHELATRLQLSQRSGA